MNQMNSRYLLPGILMALLWLWVGCTQAEPAPTATATGSVPAVSQTTPTILPTNTAVPPTATPTATLPPTATTTPIPTATATPPPTPVGPGPTVTPISVSDKVGFELVAQVGGAINSFAVSGDYILAGQGPRLLVLDASDLANLTPISQSEVLPGIVSNIMVRGETAVFTADHLLMVWDISDPTEPVMAHSLALPAAGSLLWQDDIIYAAGLIARQYVEQDGSSSQYFESYVAAIDISGPPRLLDQITLPYYIITTALVADILYVSIADQPAQNVLGVDVTNPAQLGDPISIPLATDVIFSLRAYGDTLLVGGYYKLSAFDVSDPRRPRYLWREEGAEIAQVYDFAVHDQQAHTLGWQAAGAFIPAQAVIDLPQPLPEPTTLTPAGRQIRRTLGIGLTVVDDHLFRLLDTSLTLFHLEQETQTLVSEYTPPVGGHPAIWDETLYVGLEAGYVDSYRLADLTPLDRYTLPHDETAEFSPAIYSLTAANGRLYLTSQRQYHILDATSLTPLGHFDYDEDESLSFLFQQEGRRLALPVVDNIIYAYALTLSGYEMIVRLDANNPDEIQSLSPLVIARSFTLIQLTATSNWLLLSERGSPADGQDYLTLYDSMDVSQESLLDIPVNLAPTALYLQDELLLAGGGGTFQDDGFLDIYRLPETIPLASLRLPGVYDIAMIGDLALITTQTDRRLLVFDLSDPANPLAVGAFVLPYHRGHLAVSGDTVLVSDPVMGLYLLRLER
jgi:hypothetical protein